MRMEPSEEFMYKRMDRKDRLVMLMLTCGLAGSFGLFLTAASTFVIPGVVLCSLAFGGMTLSGLQIRWLGALIMPLTGCFIEIRCNCLLAAQPYQAGQYESCRLYFDEMEQVAKAKGVSGFFIRMKGNGKSMIQSEGGVHRTLFFVSSFGYSSEEFARFYTRVKEKLPQTVQIAEMPD